jgi:hypothetical protein
MANRLTHKTVTQGGNAASPFLNINRDIARHGLLLKPSQQAVPKTLVPVRPMRLTVTHV